MNENIIVLSVGGSLVVPNEIDVDFIKSLKELLIKRNERFILVVGGGRTARKYQIALSNFNISQDEKDWVGISATKLNAQLIKSVFGKSCNSLIVSNPTVKLDFNEKFLVASGWKPGFSTDFDAVMLAENFGAKKVINLSNIEYAYDKDPNKFGDAKKIKNINWDGFRKIVGDVWNPGLNAPFDPIASKKAQDLGLEVVILNGKNLNNLNNCFDNKNFIGTRISD
jgi:uridylate kinase